MRSFSCVLILATLLGCGSEVIAVSPSSTDSTSSDTTTSSPCKGEPPALSIDGVHFAIVEVYQPLATQMALFFTIEHPFGTLNAEGQLANADRNPEIECEPACTNDMVCSLSKGCVVASENPTSVAEYADFRANTKPPTGYVAVFQGCVYDDSGGTFVSEPFDIEIASPPVNITDVIMSWAISIDPDGVVRGEGTFVSGELYLGSSAAGGAKATLSVRSIPGDMPP